MEIDIEHAWKRKKREFFFPWLKEVLKQFSNIFPEVDQSKALQTLHKNVEEEFHSIFYPENRKRAEALYIVLKSIFMNFCWKIRWKEMVKDCCLKLLCYLTYLGLHLAEIEKDKWMDQLLTIFKLVPDESVLYDCLLLINISTVKQKNRYAVLLQHILCKETISLLPEAKTYVKVILLFERLRCLTKQDRQAAITRIASEIPPPADLSAWLSSLALEDPQAVESSSVTQFILSGSIEMSSLQKLREAALGKENVDWMDSFIENRNMQNNQRKMNSLESKDCNMQEKKHAKLKGNNYEANIQKKIEIPVAEDSVDVEVSSKEENRNMQNRRKMNDLESKDCIMKEKRKEKQHAKLKGNNYEADIQKKIEIPVVEDSVDVEINSKQENRNMQNNRRKMNDLESEDCNMKEKKMNEKNHATFKGNNYEANIHKKIEIPIVEDSVDVEINLKQENRNMQSNRRRMNDLESEDFNMKEKKMNEKKCAKLKGNNYEANIQKKIEIPVVEDSVDVEINSKQERKQENRNMQNNKRKMNDLGSKDCNMKEKKMNEKKRAKLEGKNYEANIPKKIEISVLEGSVNVEINSKQSLCKIDGKNIMTFSDCISGSTVSPVCDKATSTKDIFYEREHSASANKATFTHDVEEPLCENGLQQTLNCTKPTLFERGQNIEAETWSCDNTSVMREEINAHFGENAHPTGETFFSSNSCAVNEDSIQRSCSKNLQPHSVYEDHEIASHGMNAVCWKEHVAENCCLSKIEFSRQNGDICAIKNSSLPDRSAINCHAHNTHHDVCPHNVILEKTCSNCSILRTSLPLKQPNHKMDNLCIKRAIVSLMNSTHDSKLCCHSNSRCNEKVCRSCTKAVVKNKQNNLKHSFSSRTEVCNCSAEIACLCVENGVNSAFIRESRKRCRSAGCVNCGSSPVPAQLEDSEMCCAKAVKAFESCHQNVCCRVHKNFSCSTDNSLKICSCECESDIDASNLCKNSHHHRSICIERPRKSLPVPKNVLNKKNRTFSVPNKSSQSHIETDFREDTTNVSHTQSIRFQNSMESCDRISRLMLMEQLRGISVAQQNPILDERISEALLCNTISKNDVFPKMPILFSSALHMDDAHQRSDSNSSPSTSKDSGNSSYLCYGETSPVEQRNQEMIRKDSTNPVPGNFVSAHNGDSTNPVPLEDNGGQFLLKDGVNRAANTDLIDKVPSHSTYSAPDIANDGHCTENERDVDHLNSVANFNGMQNTAPFCNNDDSLYLSFGEVAKAGNNSAFLSNGQSSEEHSSLPQATSRNCAQNVMSQSTQLINNQNQNIGELENLNSKPLDSFPVAFSYPASKINVDLGRNCDANFFNHAEELGIKSINYPEENLCINSSFIPENTAHNSAINSTKAVSINANVGQESINLELSSDDRVESIENNGNCKMYKSFVENKKQISQTKYRANDKIPLHLNAAQQEYIHRKLISEFPEENSVTNQNCEVANNFVETDTEEYSQTEHPANECVASKTSAQYRADAFTTDCSEFHSPDSSDSSIRPSDDEGLCKEVVHKKRVKKSLPNNKCKQSTPILTPAKLHIYSSPSDLSSDFESNLTEKKRKHSSNRLSLRKKHASTKKAPTILDKEENVSKQQVLDVEPKKAEQGLPTILDFEEKGYNLRRRRNLVTPKKL